MGLSPNVAETLWIGGLVLLGLFLVLKFFERRRYTEETFDRRRLRRGRDDPPDPDEMPDLTPMLRRTRLQIVLAAIGIASLIFIGLMHIGEDYAGIPLPAGLFD